MKYLSIPLFLLCIILSSCDDDTDQFDSSQYVDVYCKNSVDRSVIIELFRYKSPFLNLQLNIDSTIKIDGGKIDVFGTTFSAPFELDSAVISFADGRKLVQVQTSNRVFSDTINCILNSFDYDKDYEGNVEKWIFTLTQADYERAR
jgi:hypothetical protein